jgi:hypothetical protein
MLDLDKVNTARELLAESLREAVSSPPPMGTLTSYTDIKTMDPRRILEDAAIAASWATHVAKVARAVKATTNILGYYRLGSR